VPNSRAIRLGSLNTELGETRDFGRAFTLQNVDILKTNEISRRKGLVRRLEARAAGPIRMLHSFGGICGRFYSYFDGGGLISIVGPSYWAPTAFTATGAPPFIALSWQYQDKNGHRTTPPTGCTGVKIYRSTSAFIDTFDTGTLVYSGNGTSCVDDTAAPATDTAIYYTCYTVWEDNSRIVDPRIVMAWTYYIPAGWYVLDDFIYDASGTQYDAIPAPEIPPSTGSLSDDNGTSITNPGVNRDRDEIEKAEAEAAIDEDDPTLSFNDSAERSALNTVDLYWAYNGPAKYNSGYTSIYRSTTSGSGINGTLIRREANLYNVYTDTTADDYTTQYYTFVHNIDGVGIYTYEKTVVAKTRSMSLSAPATAYSGVAFNTTIQMTHWDGTNNTEYTPTAALALTVVGTATAISPTSTSTSGWSLGAKTVSTTLTCVGEGSTSIYATGGGLTAGDTLLNKVHTLTVSITEDFMLGDTATLTIQGVNWNGGNDTDYVPSTQLSLSIGNANTLSTTVVPQTGWSGGAKTMTLSLTGSVYGADTITVSNATGDSGTDTFTYRQLYFLDTLPYSGNLVGQGSWIADGAYPSLLVGGGVTYPAQDSTTYRAAVTGHDITSGSYVYGYTISISMTLTKDLDEYLSFTCFLFMYAQLNLRASLVHQDLAGTATVQFGAVGSVYETWSGTNSGTYNVRYECVKLPSEADKSYLYVNDVLLGAAATQELTYPRNILLTGYIPSASDDVPAVTIQMSSPYIYSS
jgi:hypothetical protein